MSDAVRVFLTRIAAEQRFPFALETLRFLALTIRGHVESVERQRAWQATLDRDAFFDEVFNEPPKVWSVPE